MSQDMTSGDDRDLRARLEELERKCAYFKRQADELSAVNIRNDSRLSSARLRLRQKEQAFELLARLQGMTGIRDDIGEVAAHVLSTLHGHMNLARSVIFTRDPDTGAFHPRFWLGYAGEDAEAMRRRPFPDSPALRAPDGYLLATREEYPEAETAVIEERFLARFFIVVPILQHGQAEGLLLAARETEAMPFHHRLDMADVETLRAVAAFLAVTFENKELYSNLEHKVAERTEQLRRHLAKEQLISEISTRFITVDADEAESRLIAALGEMGEFVGADRVRLLGEIEHHMVETTWQRPGTVAAPDRDARPHVCVLGADAPQASIETLEQQLRADGTRAALVTPFRFGDDLLGFFSVESLRDDVTWGEGEADTAKVVSQIVSSVLWRRRLMEELRRQAETDPLTGAANRRSFMDRYQRELKRAQRYGTPLSLLSVDLDFFKRINDTYGHDAGDEVLKRFVATVGGLLREQDVLGRLGGEEFAVLLPETDLDNARAAAERIRKAVGALTFESDGRSFGVTTSIGAAQHRLDGETIEQCFKRVDEVLYEAKEGGRNRVVCAR